MSRLSKTDLARAQHYEDAIYEKKGYKSPTVRATNVMLGVIALMLVLLIVSFGYVPVSGTSMLPTIKEKGDSVIIFKYATIERGDIVVIDNSDLLLHGTDKLLIKRVIAVSGDTITYRADATGKLVLKVNGEVVNESYVKEDLYLDEVDHLQDRVQSAQLTIPDGCVYVMGDNRLVSHDSRNFGAIKIDRLVGEAIILIRR